MAGGIPAALELWGRGLVLSLNSLKWRKTMFLGPAVRRVRPLHLGTTRSSWRPADPPLSLPFPVSLQIPLKDVSMRFKIRIPGG